MTANYREPPLSSWVLSEQNRALQDVGEEDALEALVGDSERRESAVGVEANGERLDKFLVSVAGEFSRSHLQKLLKEGAVVVDGVVQTQAARRLRYAQVVRVELRPTDESQAFRPQEMPLDIVWEDEHLLVIHKPAGLVVHPAAGHWSGTLLNGLLAHHAGAMHVPRAGIVHRLDKDTSGLMVVAKTLPVATTLVQMIAARTVSRRYLALSHGRWPEAIHEVDAPIGRDLKSRTRMAVVASGKPARTSVESWLQTEAHSLLHCTLHTGRTHQIRVHCAHLGHPLVGDLAYGGRADGTFHRQALHAFRLAFEHPVTGQGLSFVRLPPPDFDELAQRCLGAKVTGLLRAAARRQG